MSTTSLVLIPSFKPPPSNLGRNLTQYERTTMLLASLGTTNDVLSTFKELGSFVEHNQQFKKRRTEDEVDLANDFSLFDGLVQLQPPVTFPGVHPTFITQSTPNRYDNESNTVSQVNNRFEITPKTLITNGIGNSLLYPTQELKSSIGTATSKVNSLARPSSASSVGSLDFLLNSGSVYPPEKKKVTKKAGDQLPFQTNHQPAHQSTQQSTQRIHVNPFNTVPVVNNMNTSTNNVTARLVTATLSVPNGNKISKTSTVPRPPVSVQQPTRLSSSSGNLNASADKYSQNSVNPSDFAGIEAVCRNGGTSKQGLQALLQKIISLGDNIGHNSHHTAPSSGNTSSATSSAVVISFLYSDYQSSHSSLTSKYCTASTHCPNWLCAHCDTHIRAVQSTEKLLGMLVMFETEQEYVYFVPLVTCIEPAEDRALSGNNSPLSSTDVLLPLTCHTTLTERWDFVFGVLAAPTAARKVVFNSQLSLLPVTRYLRRRKIEQRAQQTPRHFSNSGGSGDTNNSGRIVSDSVTENIVNIFDPRIAAYMCDSDIAEENLDLLSLLHKYKVHNRSSSSQHSGSLQSESVGRLTRALHTMRGEMASLFGLHDVLTARLLEFETYAVFSNIEMPLAVILSDMESSGCRVSADFLAQTQSAVRAKIQETQATAQRLIESHDPNSGVDYQNINTSNNIHGIASSNNSTVANAAHKTYAHNHTYNLASPEQVSYILYSHFKLPLPPGNSRKNKHYSTSEEDLLRIKQCHEIVEHILNFRALNKILTTYCESFRQFVHSVDSSGRDRDNHNPFSQRPPQFSSGSSSSSGSVVHRIHANWNQTIVRTGRLSCSRPNLQNLPNKQGVAGLEINMRRVVVADPGQVLVSADYSQIEMRILAHLCQDTAMIELFNRDRDIYRQLASKIMNKPVDAITSEERNKAKVICLGVLYGMGPQTTAARLGIEVSAAQQITNSFFGHFRQMKGWIAQIKSQAKQHGYIRTLLGRRRFLPDLTSDDSVKCALAERQAVNSVIQGTASDVIKYAMINIDAKLSTFNNQNRNVTDDFGTAHPVPRLLMQIHDELIYSVPDDPAVVYSFVETLHSAMNSDIMSMLRLRIPLLVNVQTGRSWGEMEEYDV